MPALTPRQFALLEFLMRRSGQVVPKRVILEHVWDFTYDGVSNVVDQYVLYLRRKIDRPFGLEQLETVRGAGYRLRTQPHTSPEGCGPAVPERSEAR